MQENSEGSDIVCRPSMKRYREEEGLYRSNGRFMGRKGYGYLGLKSQNLRDQASRLEKMEQEQNYTRNNSTLFESGNRLEIESDDIEEKAPEENNIQADLRNIQNNSPQQQFENANSVISDFHQPVTTESGRVPSPTGLASTIVTDETKSNQICPIMSRFLPK